MFAEHLNHYPEDVKRFFKFATLKGLMNTYHHCIHMANTIKAHNFKLPAKFDNGSDITHRDVLNVNKIVEYYETMAKAYQHLLDMTVEGSDFVDRCNYVRIKKPDYNPNAEIHEITVPPTFINIREY